MKCFTSVLVLIKSIRSMKIKLNTFLWDENVIIINKISFYYYLCLHYSKSRLLRTYLKWIDPYSAVIFIPCRNKLQRCKLARLSDFYKCILLYDAKTSIFYYNACIQCSIIADKYCNLRIIVILALIMQSARTAVICC